MTDANIRRPPTGWIFTSLRGYRMGWLPGDLVAGLMLAAIAIPGQLATARLAGMPPQTGLYAFAAGSFAFAAFGANRFMSVAADSTIAPIFAGGLASIAVAGPAHYTEMATLLALLVGIVLVAVGLPRAGWLATLLSIPVTTGFLAGISIHIIVGELPIMLGVAGWHGHLLVRLVHTFGQLRDTNLYTLTLGVGILIVTMGMARISPRIPGALIGLVGAGLAVALFHFEAHGVSLVGPSRSHCRASPSRPYRGWTNLATCSNWPWWSPWSASCRRQQWRALSRPTTERPTM
jgi:SulP family sulfate permease